MVLKIGLIIVVSAIVFWGIGRFLPKIFKALKGRIKPLLLPLAFPVARRVLWLLLRLLLFRR